MRSSTDALVSKFRLKDDDGMEDKSTALATSFVRSKSIQRTCHLPITYVSAFSGSTKHPVLGRRHSSMK